MDERLEKALEFGNFRQTLANQKKNIKERFNIQRKIHYNGGSFVADEKTITFVATLKNLDISSTILIDTKETPIEIKNIEEFLEILLNSYKDSTFEYKTNIDKINKMRNIKKIMDW